MIKSLKNINGQLPAKSDFIAVDTQPNPDSSYLFRLKESPAVGKKSTHQGNIIIICFTIAKLALHLAANSNYGLHCDELYYIGLSKHLQWGYLDNGPFIAWIARLSSGLFNADPFSWRLIPTVCSALVVFFTGKITQRLGGGKLAIVIACSALLASPAFMATSYMLQPAIFDQLFWTLMMFGIVCYNDRVNRSAYFFIACMALGFGILNKLSILLGFVTLVMPLLLTNGGKRRTFAKPLMLALPALVIVLPNILWQYQQGFPAVTYVQSVATRHVYEGLGDYLIQLLFFHGASMSVWLAGLCYLLTANTPIRRYRNAAFGFVALVVIIYILHGKLYYILGAFPFLFAAGAVCWEQMLSKTSVIAKSFLLGSIYMVGMAALPVVIPIFSFAHMQAYVNLMTTYTPINQPLRWEDGRVHEIPQYFADMLGWKEFVSCVKKAGAINRDTSAQGIAVYTDNYTAAGAIAYYGTDDEFKIYASGNSFAQWSPRLLPNELVYISVEPFNVVKRYGKEVIKCVGVNRQAASAAQLKIYYIKDPSQSFVTSYRLSAQKLN